jgi:hypothetical protein
MEFVMADLWFAAAVFAASTILYVATFFAVDPERIQQLWLMHALALLVFFTHIASMGRNIRDPKNVDAWMKRNSPWLRRLGLAHPECRGVPCRCFRCRERGLARKERGQIRGCLARPGRARTYGSRIPDVARFRDPLFSEFLDGFFRLPPVDHARQAHGTQQRPVSSRPTFSVEWSQLIHLH